MNTIGRNLNRRAFLKLPALLPFTAFGSALLYEEYDFQYEGVLGTSMDLALWTSSSRLAERACQTVLDEIGRLAAILDTRNPTSEISALEGSGGAWKGSYDLGKVVAAYNYWEHRTSGVFSIRPGGPGVPRNVDALGKAYILDCAAKAVRRTYPSIHALLLNIGGDIVVWGPPVEVLIADPGSSYDNAGPISAIRLQNAAVATSGTYARGAHLIDGRTGIPPGIIAAATVVADDAVTANALASTLCLTRAQYGLQLVESTKGAEALRIESGVLQRTSGFALLERQTPTPSSAASGWPQGYHVTVTLRLKSGRSSKRPYVSVWVEDSSGKLIRMLAFWGGKSKYFGELSSAWSLMKGNQRQLRTISRATRPAGKYDLIWDGLDNEQKPVSLGTYRITVETNQEHGVYAKQAGTINLGDQPTSITLPATTNFEAVSVQYGPA